jgi:hypothetical protein
MDPAGGVTLEITARSSDAAVSERVVNAIS